MKLRIAVGQFPVNADVASNLTHIEHQIAAAAAQRADVILFPETALGGYAGCDFESFADYDWDLLRTATQRVAETARLHRLWVVLGSNHRLTGRSKPHNSMYVIDDGGRIVDRYDKRFCTVGDLAYYRPGVRPVVTSIRGVRCGLLICHEWRYPELYRQYKKLKVDLILQGWYDGGLSAKEMKTDGDVYSKVIPATVQGHAACNHFWICGANNSRRHSCFGGFVVRPNGTILKRQALHRSGVMVCAIDTDVTMKDEAAHGRPRAMRGVESLGPAVKDRRSQDRHCY